MEILLERVTQMALYNTVTSKRKPTSVQPCSTIYSGYSAHAVKMQYGDVDVTLDVIRGIGMQSEEGHMHFCGEFMKVDVSVFCC